MTSSPDRFLRLVCALASVSVGAATVAACGARSVDPGDGSVTITDTVTSSDAVADGALPGCENPGPENASCAIEVTCGPQQCGAWRCLRVPSGELQWMRLFCGGPVRPPEMA